MKLDDSSRYVSDDFERREAIIWNMNAAKAARASAGLKAVVDVPGTQANSTATKAADAVVKMNGTVKPKKVELSARDFETARKEFVPLSLKDVKLQHSDVSWTDIGGESSCPKIRRSTAC